MVRNSSDFSTPELYESSASFDAEAPKVRNSSDSRTLGAELSPNNSSVTAINPVSPAHSLRGRAVVGRSLQAVVPEFISKLHS